MAKGNLSACLPITLRYEGGFTKNPKDPGNWTGGKVGKGELKGTNMGIAANSHPKLDIRNLTLEDAKAIYGAEYWAPAGCEALEYGLDLVHFDASVNSGVGRAKKLLAGAGDVSATVKAIQRYCSLRLSFVQGLKAWATFGKGWRSRIADVEARAVKMYMASISVAPGPVLKREAEIAVEKAKTSEKTAAGTGAAAGGGGLTFGSLDHGWKVLVPVAVLTVLIVLWCWHKRSADRSRAEAYSRVAAES